MGRAGRSLEDDEVAGRLDRADPFGEDALEPVGGPVAVADLVGQCVAEHAAALDLDRAQLVEIARHGRLVDLEAARGEPGGHLLLAGERLAADDVGERLLAPGAGVGHCRNIHAKAPRALCMRFSAWRQTALRPLSITSWLTSSPRRAGRQWRNQAWSLFAIKASSTW